MADKQLATARAQFVNRVTKPVLKQLLDDLLEDRVLNDEEQETVDQENSMRADQARSLIDMVRRKGPRASEKLLSRLKERDPGLFDQLGLGSDPQPAQPVAAPSLKPSEEEKPVSPVLTLCTEQDQRKVLEKKSSSIYIPKKKPERKRLALLINNINFDRESMLRRGADKDEERMEKLLRDLDYDVVKHRNLSGQDIDKMVEEFSKCEEHSLSDSTFVVIMSHGKRDAICGIHHDTSKKVDDLFKIDNIFKHLNTENCRNLLNKPKIIIIQACRGEEGGSTLVCDSESEIVPAGLEDDSGVRREHKEKDFISLMSCTPDTVSYRDPKEGALFIQWFVETFNTYAHEDHIQKLFTKVLRRFDKFPRQMPSMDRVTLTKKFYLLPGL
ncbi:hypothetical protein AAFF_G00036880 [Aldrovandia affinis]|uniref:Caspase-1 n=1 Tax=Aldrovandia affinis TaxID=143900 RepID=A0AAD7T6L8_9TELE|nr:hypothetical protein AAFF_G00036880 [Aldrovandia affinis]